MRVLLMAALVAAGIAVLATPAQAQAPRVTTSTTPGTTIQGQVIRVSPTNNSFVVLGPEGRQVTVYTTPQATFRFGERPARLSDLKEGSRVTVDYDLRDNRYMARSVTWTENATLSPSPAQTTTAAPAPVLTGTPLQGTIVRLEGSDQVLVRTPDNREVVFYADPQTVYRLQDRSVGFVDLRPGMPVTVTYDLRDRRPFARTIIGGPFRNP